MDLYRPKCLQAGYTPVSKRVAPYISSERARQIIGHSLSMIKKFDHLDGMYDRDLTKEEYSALVRYTLSSNTWYDITDDMGDWNDVTSFTNTNKTLRLSFICGSQLRLTLIK